MDYLNTSSPLTSTTYRPLTNTTQPSTTTWNGTQSQVFSQSQQQLLLNLILQLLIQLAQQHNNSQPATNTTNTTGTPAPTPAPTGQTNTPANGQKVIDVYLLGGQSNAAALGAKRLEGALENTLGADTALHETNVFSYAAGGTHLYQQWKGDGTADASKDGLVYKQFQTQLDKYLTKLRKDNPDAQINIKGMFWHQGEADARDKKGAEYETNLTRFIQDIRATTHVDNLPFMIGRLNEVNVAGRDHVPIQKAQDAVGAKDPNAVSVNLETLKPLASGVHFTQKGYDTMAQLFAEAYKTNFSR
ncbi:sialate O-acetylesterase [Thiofilum flexile]|uniref:sialate O-acetylesterase n=1 Tax=Thiofilum flexile TaxID=125627 RepID=UPI000372B786|nr:sialate O-acetylesterase [Thiofilum flexile]